MRTHPFTALQLLAAIASLLAVLVHFMPTPALVYVCKPLATTLIIGIAFANWRAHRDAYALCITIGLLFALGGDIGLLWPDRYFLPGLGAFLLAHVAYLAAFTRDARFPARFAVWLFYLALVGALYVYLFAHFPPSLKLPVAIYSVLLASMAAQAMGRSLTLRTAAARFAAVGAVFFLLSDALLVFDRFHTPLHPAPVLILVPYYLGQLLIASSTGVCAALRLPSGSR